MSWLVGETARERALWTVGYGVSGLLMLAGLTVWVLASSMLLLAWSTAGLWVASQRMACPWGERT